jgi:hypothetical protein
MPGPHVKRSSKIMRAHSHRMTGQLIASATNGELQPNDQVGKKGAVEIA